MAVASEFLRKTHGAGISGKIIFCIVVWGAFCYHYQMAADVVPLNASRVRIVLLCGDKHIGKSLAYRLRSCGATVALADDLVLVLEDIEKVEPDAVWAIASGDDAFRIGQFCRLLEVDNVMNPHPWKLYWVGDHVPDVSVLAASFPALPCVKQILQHSCAFRAEESVQNCGRPILRMPRR